MKLGTLKKGSRISLQVSGQAGILLTLVFDIAGSLLLGLSPAESLGRGSVLLSRAHGTVSRHFFDSNYHSHHVVASFYETREPTQNHGCGSQWCASGARADRALHPDLPKARVSFCSDSATSAAAFHAPY